MGTPLRLAMLNSDGKLYPPLPEPPDVTITLHQLRLRVFPRNAYDHLFTELGTVAAGEAALTGGCDGIYIDTFGDYGLERLRAVTDLPVVGAGEASIAAAADRLGRYSIVTVWPASMGYLYDDRLSRAPGGERCAGVHHLTDAAELDRVGTDQGVKARLRRSDEVLLDELAALARSAVARDGSAGVLLGCTCMSTVADGLAATTGLEVMDPSRVGLEAALAALQGLPSPQPAASSLGAEAEGPGLATEMLDAHLARLGVERDERGGCDACVTAAP